MENEPYLEEQEYFNKLSQNVCDTWFKLSKNPLFRRSFHSKSPSFYDRIYRKTLKLLNHKSFLNQQVIQSTLKQHIITCLRYVDVNSDLYNRFHELSTSLSDISSNNNYGTADLSISNHEKYLKKFLEKVQINSDNNDVDDNFLNYVLANYKHFHNHLNFSTDDMQEFLNSLITLLYNSDRFEFLINLLNSLTQENAIHLINHINIKLEIRLNIKVWKNILKIKEIVIKTFLDKAVLSPLYDDNVIVFLKILIKEYISVINKIHSSTLKTKIYITEQINKVFSSVHIMVFHEVINEVLKEDYNVFKNEICLKGLEVFSKEIEQMRDNHIDNYMKNKKYLALLIDYFGNLHKTKIVIYRECIITSFSLDPTYTRLKLIEQFALELGIEKSDPNALLGHKKCETSMEKMSRFKKKYRINETNISKNEKSNIFSLNSTDALGPYCTKNYLFNQARNSGMVEKNDRSSFAIEQSKLTALLNSNFAGLPLTSCQILFDLITRYKSEKLNWESGWKHLYSQCVDYLEKYSKINDYSNINYSNFIFLCNKKAFLSIIYTNYMSIYEPKLNKSENLNTSVLNNNSNESSDEGIRHESKLKNEKITSDEDIFSTILNVKSNGCDKFSLNPTPVISKTIFNDSSSTFNIDKLVDWKKIKCGSKSKNKQREGYFSENLKSDIFIKEINTEVKQYLNNAPLSSASRILCDISSKNILISKELKKFDFEFLKKGIKDFKNSNKKKVYKNFRFFNDLTNTKRIFRELNSLDMFIPEIPEAIIQIMQISNIRNPLPKSHAVATTTEAINFSSSTQTETCSGREASFSKTGICHVNALVESTSQTCVSIDSENLKKSNDSTESSCQKKLMPITSMLLTSVPNNCTINSKSESNNSQSSVYSLDNKNFLKNSNSVNNNNISNSDNYNSNNNWNSKAICVKSNLSNRTPELSTQISAHIQRIGHPQKSVKKNILKKGSSIKHNTDGFKMKRTYKSNEVFRFVIKNGKIEQCSSLLQDVSFSEAVVGNLNSKTQSSENLSEQVVPSLPKFNQVFGRQIYQTCSSNNVTQTNNQFQQEIIIKVEEMEPQVSVSSIGVQTSDDLDEPAMQFKDFNCNYGVIKTYSCGINKAAQISNEKNALDLKNLPDLQPATSQGVIFTCKVPANISSSSIIKPCPQSNFSKTFVKSSDEEKETVIKSNMNSLLSAALQSPTLHRSFASPTEISNGNRSQSKSPVTSRITDIFNPIQRCTTLSQLLAAKTTQSQISNPQKYSKPLHISCEPLSVSCQADTDFTKKSQVLSASSNLTLSINSNNEAKLITQHCAPQSVSSTTLEQLREFESVLQQVTNTSQMKERSCVNSTFEKPIEYQDIVTQTSSDLDSPNGLKDSSMYHSVGTSVSDGFDEDLNLSFFGNKSPNSTFAQTNFSKITAPVVVLQSRQLNSPTLSLNNSNSSMSPTYSSNQCKLSPKSNKSKGKSGKISPTTNSLRISTLTKPQQKPQEDEQTTQRIYAILDKYAEQLRNSPELKNKPAPRRRSNPPVNPNHTKRKKSSSSSSGRARSPQNYSSSSLDLSPCSEDFQTICSEDSSNGVNQSTQVFNSSSDDLDDLSNPGIDEKMEDVLPDEHDESNETPSVKVTVSDSSTNTCRSLLQDEPSTVVNVDSSKIIGSKQVVLGSNTSLPLTLSIPSGANVKQVILPVPTDGRPFVVAKVPKMYRVHQVTMPNGSPLLATAGSGTVVLRPMCLNKSSANIKQLKVPIVSTLPSHNLCSGNSQAATVVLPSNHSFTIAADSRTIDATSMGLLENAIVLNSQTSSALGSLLTRNISKVNNSESFSDFSNDKKFKSIDFNIINHFTKETKHISTNAPSLHHIKIEPGLETETNKYGNDKISQCSLDDEYFKPINENPNSINNSNTRKNTVTNIKVEPTVIKRENDEDSNKPAKEFILKRIPTNPENNEQRKGVQDYIEMNELIKRDINTRLKQEFPVYEEEEDLKKKLSRSLFKDNSLNEEPCAKRMYFSESWNYMNRNLTVSDKNSDCFSQDNDNDDNEPETCLKSNPLLLSHSLDSQLSSENTENTLFQIEFNPTETVRDDLGKDDSTQNSRSSGDPELELVDNLTEECEGLGVGKPSTSELFPDAELLIDSDPLSGDSIQNELFSKENSLSNKVSPIIGFDSNIWQKIKKEPIDDYNDSVCKTTNNEQQENQNQTMFHLPNKISGNNNNNNTDIFSADTFLIKNDSISGSANQLKIGKLVFSENDLMSKCGNNSSFSTLQINESSFYSANCRVTDTIKSSNKINLESRKSAFIQNQKINIFNLSPKLKNSIKLESKEETNTVNSSQFYKLVNTNTYTYQASNDKELNDIQKRNQNDFIWSQLIKENLSHKINAAEGNLKRSKTFNKEEISNNSRITNGLNTFFSELEPKINFRDMTDKSSNMNNISDQLFGDIQESSLGRTTMLSNQMEDSSNSMDDVSMNLDSSVLRNVDKLPKVPFIKKEVFQYYNGSNTDTSSDSTNKSSNTTCQDISYNNKEINKNHGTTTKKR